LSLWATNGNGNTALQKYEITKGQQRWKFSGKDRSGYLFSVGVDIMALISSAARLNAYVNSSVPYFLRKAEIFLLPLKLTRDQKSC